MGGQACVLYGAAEFSRDIDFVLHVGEENLDALRNALAELDAERIAVPPFSPAFLEKGHAVHFRCRAPGVERLRIDVMSRLRGVADFAELWQRRTTIETGDVAIEVLSLPDLIAAKRTQRDKDWLMTNRLVEAHHARHAGEPTPERVRFWLRESFDLEFLSERTREFADEARNLAPLRPVIAALLENDESRAKEALSTEKAAIVDADRKYWAPLKKELETLRREESEGPRSKVQGLKVMAEWPPDFPAYCKSNIE
jgi:hypothetical protein